MGPTADSLDNRLDRVQGPAGALYRNAEANNGIDIVDAVANLQSLGHNCVAAPMLGP